MRLESEENVPLELGCEVLQNPSAPLAPFNPNLCEDERTGSPPECRQPPAPLRHSLSTTPKVDSIFRDALSLALLHNFVKETSSVMICNAPEDNPWLKCILPMAFDDPVIMHAVLAISGAHFEHQARKPISNSSASYRHYSIVLRETKYALTEWMAESKENNLRLFLLTILLCNYESVCGNLNGAMLYHVRASRHFARILMDQPLAIGEQELAEFLFESCFWFALLSNLRYSPPRNDVSQNTNLLTLSSAKMAKYKGFGPMFGNTYELFAMIPSVSHIALARQRMLSQEVAERDEEAAKEVFDMYTSLLSELTNWRPIVAEAHATKNTEASIQAAICRNTLVVFLHAAFWYGFQSQAELLQKVDPFVNETFELVEHLRKKGASTGAGVFWLFIVTSTYIRDKPRQNAVLRQVKEVPVRLPLLDRAEDTLNWVWCNGNDDSYGLPALENFIKAHKTGLCVG
ncbi:hypothetical protein K469DRAFT_608208 [Zopfia rhizophila CBS 207.26]|uniref:Transcription factor domain-containing protein n=1 Tax=Zopfia rhizophila CBS 207.26 TaxID=1314779 RepID=A0A6A6D9J0_9PEZI|nr:hypothetical protein K469DRAFT_608208 [Zopfia rhizophila CBS 207.26]